MKKLTQTIAQVATGISATLVLMAGKAMAVEGDGTINSVEEGAAAARADGMPEHLFGDSGVITNLTNTALLVIGLISVIMLIYGGIRYIVSGGDSKKVTDAKNTILYAIIGLIICVLSYAIVNFVLTSIGVSSGTIQ